MKKTVIISIVAGLVLALYSFTGAQQPTKIPRIGFLFALSPSVVSARIEAFRQGMRELRYVERKNIVIEWRFAEEKPDRLSALAAELVRLKVDIIVTAGPSATRSAKNATVTIPIVMAFDDDPVGSGFVINLRQPGGNITGLSALSPEISGKQMELLKEIVPGLSHLTVLGSSTHPGTAQSLEEMKLAARAFKIQLEYVNIVDPKDIGTAFGVSRRGPVDAVLVLSSPMLLSQRAELAELAVTNRLPVIHANTEYVDAGGLMVYGTNFPDLFRRAATYVDKILKGGKPADLPIEQPTKFELVINLKAANQIGLTIPPSVLARADKVIR